MFHDISDCPNDDSVVFAGKSSPYADGVAFFDGGDWAVDKVPQFAYVLGLVPSAREEWLDWGGYECYFVGLGFHFVVV
jgi:hypothetical protein